MFLVEYLGQREDLRPQYEEFDDIKFFHKNELVKILSLEETREFLYKVFSYNNHAEG